MLLTVMSFLENFILQTKHPNVLALFLSLLLARFVSHRRRRHLDQLHVHRALKHQLVVEFGSCQHDNATSSTSLTSPIEEWCTVAENGVQAHSLVYYPIHKKTKHKTLVLIIPGNPGVPFYYLPLMQSIVKKHGRHHEIRCLSHVGHFMPWKCNGRSFTLQEQLEYKAFYLQQRLHDDPTLRLVVIGHSIGSYFLLDIARRFPQQIAKLVLMQPTIMHMALSPKGKQMSPLFNHYKCVVSLVSAVEVLVPPLLRRWIVRHVVGPKTSKTLQLASLSLVDACVMRNVLGMAANEMKEVTELDGDLVAKFEDKILFVYSAVDDWVPANFMQEYQARFPNAQHRIVLQGHAFMMETNGTRDMAAHIAQWINDVLDGNQACELNATPM